MIDFLFRLLTSRVVTADFPSPFVPIFCILLHHFSHCNVLSHRIHKPPLRSSPFPLSWQFHPQHQTMIDFLFRLLTSRVVTADFLCSSFLSVPSSASDYERLLISASHIKGRHSGFSLFPFPVSSIKGRHSGFSLFLFPVSSILSIRLWSTSYFGLSRKRSSQRIFFVPLSCQFHPQHPSPNIPIIVHPYMSKPHHDCFPCFLSKPSFPHCSSKCTHSWSYPFCHS